MSRFFSVRCAILNYKNHPNLPLIHRHQIDKAILDKLLCSYSVAQISAFEKDFSYEYLDINAVNKFMKKVNARNDKNREDLIHYGTQHQALSMTIQNLFYMEYHNCLRRCILYETIPHGEQIRIKQGMKPLSLQDGVFVDLKNLKNYGY